MTKEYLEQMDTMTRSMIKDPNMVSLYGFILKHGREFTVTPKTFPGGGQMKMCFMNSFRQADAHRNSLTYCEGFAMSVIPVHHAWCVDRHGNVIDFTWRDDITGRDYIGVPFKFKKVLEFVLKTRTYGSILDDWQNDWPILTGKTKLTDVLADYADKKEDYEA